MRPRFEIDYAVQEQRENRKRGGRTREQVEELWLQAAEDGSLCAGCFRPLSWYSESVTIIHKRIGRYRYERIRVPICLDCSLTEEQFRSRRFWGVRAGDPYIRRLRCLNCRRRMRVWWDRGHLPEARRCCCRYCYRQHRNTRAWARRHRDHQRVCVVCGEKFEPTRHDAKTCSNTCRQRLFRRRHQSRG